MTEQWNKLDGTKMPVFSEVETYVNNSAWSQLCADIEQRYEINPVFTYSRCSMQRGWNLKYKKAGRSLCTLYPMPGCFWVLVVIGEREAAEMEVALPAFSTYIRELYEKNQSCMGQKWLMIEVKDTQTLPDVMHLLAIRQAKKGK
ncbi:MAG: DUF3788 domain-containing protein [Anaerolineae bacterium]|nr:DUF3788 domain-containing protein [Anaerolineae bacterium]